MGKIDYKLEIEKAKKLCSSEKLNAICLAPSGAGKSALAGTFGVPTLYLYGSSESHGPVTARAFSNCEVTPICIDKGRSPSQAFYFLKDILSDKEFLKGFEAIVLDSANCLELIIRDTDNFKLGCTSEKGKHNSFSEGPVALAMFNEVLSLLRDSEKHTVITCILDVMEMDSETKEILASTPKLSTYRLAEGVVLQHGDIFTVGPLVNGEKEDFRIQFTARMSKSSKDTSGKVKMHINFTPRLAGVTKKLPSSLPAKLSDLIEYKRKLKDEVSNIPSKQGTKAT